MTHFLSIFGQTTDVMTTSSSDPASIAGFIIVLILAAAVLAAVIIASYRTFKKAGKPGWAAIVPFYSSYVLSEISGRPGWFGLVAVLVAFIPFVGSIASIVMTIFICIDVAHKFHRSTAFGVIGLFIFSPVGFGILGFGDARYDASVINTLPGSNTGTSPGNGPAGPISGGRDNGLPPTSPTPPSNPAPLV